MALNVPDLQAALDAEAAAVAGTADAAVPEAGAPASATPIRASSATKKHGKEGKGGGGGKKDAAAPQAPMPRMAVVDAVPLETELLDTLRSALRTYRR